MRDALKDKKQRLMAAGAHLKTQIQPTKSKRRKRRETTISAAAPNSPEHSSSSSAGDLLQLRKRDPPTVVAPDTSWCCSASKHNPSSSVLHPPPTHCQQQQRRTIPTISATTPTLPPPDQLLAPFPVTITVNSSSSTSQSLSESSSAAFKLGFSPCTGSPVMMDSSIASGVCVNGGSNFGSFPSSYSKFNSALNAGLLNPMSPPPPPLDKTRSSPTLFEMMANEPDCHPRNSTPAIHAPVLLGKPQITVQDRQILLQQRAGEILGSCSPGNQFNDPTSSDIKLTLSSKDGLTVSMNVHRHILVVHSRFFAAKLSDRWSKQQRSLPHIIEISDCEDIEIYMETLGLMYCKDVRKKLMKEDVSKVLGILKVSAAILFDAGIVSCLEYLEAAPWAEDEEEKVASLLSQLHLEGAGAGEVLKRVSVEAATGAKDGNNNNEEVLLRLLQAVLEGKDEKARKEMKGLVSKMLRENSSQNDLSKESLYSASDGCLQLLRKHFLKAASSDLNDAGQIARQADNLHWILDILIDRQIAEDFLKTWASQGDLSEAHRRVPAVHRYEVSRVTARFFVGIGKGQLLASKEVRCLFLQTWLEPFYEDFGWMRRASKGLDRHLIEDGLSNTILTLPLPWQQEILLAWFNRFLNSGENCPNIQRGFEVWWRRAFWKRNGGPERPPQIRIAAASSDH
ncbi:BTB/POZ domain-containing protein At1g63850-like [Telopea speciosissima]|uniref:BTB/POZ domain-containing protein At1g63850-like n=1 Tax=Telopea speciosissima TaxID=54955 RepID=UPI001CC576D1|nr:BTB/POZ domain-containing protein At1g63850-like [Telopea speciosissima]